MNLFYNLVSLAKKRYICFEIHSLMSNYCIYIPLPKYLQEWLICRFGSPVVFPAGSPQNAVIRTFLALPPAGSTPDLASEGTVAVAIPDSVAKPCERYHYMSSRGKAAVAETIKDLFLRALWADITPLIKAPVGLNTLIGAWCEQNGISIDRVETVRQCYYRIRKSFSSQGVNLRYLNRKK